MDREEAIVACVALVCIAAVLIFGRPTGSSKCTCVESKPWRQDYTTTNLPARIEGDVLLHATTNVPGVEYWFVETNGTMRKIHSPH